MRPGRPEYPDPMDGFVVEPYANFGTDEPWVARIALGLPEIVYAVPSGRDPVRMSCVFGMSPTPLLIPAFSVSEICLPIALPTRASSIVSPCNCELFMAIS